MVFSCNEVGIWCHKESDKCPVAIHLHKYYLPKVRSARIISQLRKEAQVITSNVTTWKQENGEHRKQYGLVTVQGLSSLMSRILEHDGIWGFGNHQRLSDGRLRLWDPRCSGSGSGELCLGELSEDLWSSVSPLCKCFSTLLSQSSVQLLSLWQLQHDLRWAPKG